MLLAAENLSALKGQTVVDAENLANARILILHMVHSLLLHACLAAGATAFACVCGAGAVLVLCCCCAVLLAGRCLLSDP